MVILNEAFPACSSQTTLHQRAWRRKSWRIDRWQTTSLSQQHLPPELVRHASPGRSTCSQARCSCGTPNGSPPPCRGSYRRESRGSSPQLDLTDHPLATPCNTRTDPGTTPTRFRTCRTAPRRSVFSRPQDGSCRPSSFRSTHIRPTSTHRPRSNTASCSPPGRHIPTWPR